MSYWAYSSARFYIRADVPLEKIKSVFGRPFTWDDMVELNRRYREAGKSLSEEFNNEWDMREKNVPGELMGSEGSLVYDIEPCGNKYTIVHIHGALRDFFEAKPINDFYRKVCESLPIIYMYSRSADYDKYFQSKFKSGIFKSKIETHVEQMGSRGSYYIMRSEENAADW